MNARYPPVARRAGNRCEYCRAPEAVFNLTFEVEHIVPISRGGLGDESNLALSCRACNLFKADRLTVRDQETGAEVRLFDPRRDCWDEHFRIEAETGAILSLTPEGRVTVAILQMNRPVQLAARLHWMRPGLFP